MIKRPICIFSFATVWSYLKSKLILVNTRGWWDVHKLKQLTEAKWKIEPHFKIDNSNLVYGSIFWDLWQNMLILEYVASILHTFRIRLLHQKQNIWKLIFWESNQSTICKEMVSYYMDQLKNQEIWKLFSYKPQGKQIFTKSDNF